MPGTLTRRPSFSRHTRKAPPAPPHAAAAAVAAPPAITADDVDERIVLSKNLRGFLMKKHHTTKAIGPSWGKRFFHVDDDAGTIHYAKSQSTVELSKIMCRLDAIKAIQSVNGHDSSAFSRGGIVLILQSGVEHMLCAEDMEDQKMWTRQLRERVARLRAEQRAALPTPEGEGDDEATAGASRPPPLRRRRKSPQRC